MGGRYRRLESISWWQQDIVKGAKVLVVGAGALGNEVLKNLALIGVGNIILVDYDSVALVDLTRSILYKEEDIDKPKVYVAKYRLKEINPDVNVLPIKKRIEEVGWGLFRLVDVVLGCVDNRRARVAINEACFALNKPYIDGGIDVLHGKVDTFCSSLDACYECILSVDDYRALDNKYSCLREEKQDAVPTTPTVASIIAGYQVQEAIRLLHGFCIKSGVGFIYNALDYDYYIVKYQKKPDCIAHNTYEPIIGIDKSSSETTFGDIIKLAHERFNKKIEDIVVELGRDIVEEFICISCGLRQVSYKRMALDNALVQKCTKCNKLMRVKLINTISINEEKFISLTLEEVNLPKLSIIPVRNKVTNEYIYFELTKDKKDLLSF